MTKHKHLLLDIGGVLLDKSEDIVLDLYKDKVDYRKAKKILKKVQVKCDLSQASYSDYVDTFNRLVRTDYSVASFQKEKHRLRNLNKRLIDYCKSNRRKFKTSMLSDNNRSNIRYYNKHLHFQEWTYRQVYSYQYGVKKPHPKLYREILQTINASPEQCVFIDNQAENLVPAKRLGMKTILFKNNQQLFADLKKYWS